VAWLPDVQNDTPGMNTSGCPDAKEVNTPGSLNPLRWIHWGAVTFWSILYQHQTWFSKKLASARKHEVVHILPSSSQLKFDCLMYLEPAILVTYQFGRFWSIMVTGGKSTFMWWKHEYESSTKFEIPSNRSYRTKCNSPFLWHCPFKEQIGFVFPAALYVDYGMKNVFCTYLF
jgi:hypothetical protein